MQPQARRACLLLAAVASIGACGSAGADQLQTIDEHSWTSEAPEPEGDVVLAITGLIERANTESAFLLDLSLVDGLRTVRVTVDEPFLRREVRATGVLLADLVAAVEPSPGAEVVRLTALDDYQVDIALDEARTGGAVVATRVDGEPIAVSDGGPFRLMWPAGDRNGSDESRWIWNIESVELR